jgi:hypothetical protein
MVPVYTPTLTLISTPVRYSCRKGKLIFFYEVVIKLKWTGATTNQPSPSAASSAHARPPPPPARSRRRR